MNWGIFNFPVEKFPGQVELFLSKISGKDELLRILEEDPFKKHDLAEYELIEFIPTKTCEELKFLMD